MALRVGAHADHLEPQAGLAAAELAFEHAREDVAGEALVVGRRELRMQLRLAQRGLEPPLEVGAARPALDWPASIATTASEIVAPRAAGSRCRCNGQLAPCQSALRLTAIGPASGRPRRRTPARGRSRRRADRRASAAAPSFPSGCARPAARPAPARRASARPSRRRRASRPRPRARAAAIRRPLRGSPRAPR